MYLAIPKYIKIDDDEYFKFWDCETICKYIKSKFKYSKTNIINKDYKVFNINNSSTIQFMIYTKKFNKEKLLDFFTYKKIHMIQVQNTIDESLEENIKFTDNNDNEIDLLRIILDESNFIYKCFVKIKKN